MSGPRVHRGFQIFLGLFVSLLVIDQLTKWWARAAVDGVEGRSIYPLWPNVFELKLVYNQGVAFGLLQGIGPMLAPLALIMAAGAGYFSFKGAREPRYFHVMLGLLAAGAIGNMLDRVFAGKVTDMFWIRAINFPVFNVADICITFAGFLLVYNAFFGGKNEEDEKQAEPESVDPQTEVVTGLEPDQVPDQNGEDRVAENDPA